MNENKIFWLGKRASNGRRRSNFADEPEFSAAMKSTCQNYGCKVQRFVSAKGVYGTWLIEFERHGKNQRIVWNGKDEKLVLQVALDRGGWEEPSAIPIDVIDVASFADGINRLIGPDDGFDE